MHIPNINFHRRFAVVDMQLVIPAPKTPNRCGTGSAELIVKNEDQGVFSASIAQLVRARSL